LKKHRILVVDDHADAAHALERLLRAMGHEVAVAYDGRTALDQLSVTRPDVALLDITMPDMNGYELARQMRCRVDGAVRIVALTGFGLPEDRQRAIDAGFDHHVVKPVDPAFLRSLLG
jgi:CheY-like chemotaxis protein